VQSHIHGTLTDVKDGTIGVELKGETVSIKLAGDAGLFLVTKANRHECDPDW
jgi:preprotein translocase subunit YajC